MFQVLEITVTWAAADKGTKFIYATANDGTNPDLVDMMATSSEITLANNNALKLGDRRYISNMFGLDAPSTVSVLTLLHYSSRGWRSKLCFNYNRWRWNYTMDSNLNIWYKYWKSYCNGNDFRIRNKKELNYGKPEYSISFKYLR